MSSSHAKRDRSTPRSLVRSRAQTATISIGRPARGARSARRWFRPARMTPAPTVPRPGKGDAKRCGHGFVPSTVRRAPLGERARLASGAARPCASVAPRARHGPSCWRMKRSRSAAPARAARPACRYASRRQCAGAGSRPGGTMPPSRRAGGRADWSTISLHDTPHRGACPGRRMTRQRDRRAGLRCRGTSAFPIRPPDCPAPT